MVCVRTDPDRAERYLNQARRDAGSDGELRYRALYNLGWVEVSRADALLKETPDQALQHLQQAVNRFREAVRVRPDSNEARHNLEVVSQRLLELADSLAKKNPEDMASRLDEVIRQLRAHQAELQAAVQQTGEEVQKTLVETYRPEFRRLGSTQRQIIADYQRVADDARTQLDALQKKPADQQSPEEQLRAGQYASMLRFVDGALQRLNQSRGLTRRLQGNRAFRRWSLGLTESKRARDQLRNPVEIIGILLADAAELAELTHGLASATRCCPPIPRRLLYPPGSRESTSRNSKHRSWSVRKNSARYSEVLDLPVRPRRPSRRRHRNQRQLIRVVSNCSTTSRRRYR